MGQIYRTDTAFTGSGAAALPVVPKPLPVPGPLRRWDAETIRSANGTILTGWQDTANGTTLGVSVGNPTIETVDGVRAVRFTNDILQQSLTLGQPHTVVLAFKHVSLNTTGTATLFGAQEVIGTDGGVLQTTALGDLYVNAGTAYKVGSATATTGWKRVIVVFNGASSVISINGTEWAGNFGAQSRLLFSLGGQRSAQFTDTAVSHASIYPKALSSAERADLDGWLVGRVA